MKTYMTQQENERQKDNQRSWYYSSLRLISELYPTIKCLTIDYKQVYRSAFGIVDESKCLHYDSNSRDNFLIDCKNRECTYIGYDLKDIIWSMVNRHVETEEGNLDCKGSEAPDHLYQSCGSSLHYKVSIVYKD